jgi:chromosomal replication initiator protein
MDLSQLWERLISAMQERIGHQDVEIWLSRPARPLRLDGDTLWIEVDNAYYADWIQDNLVEALRIEASAALSVPVTIRLTWQGDQPEANATSLPQPAAARGVGLHPHQTFDNFVIGECNKFAHAAAEAVADRPARSYNPLFIYGATGLGKTHLMHAMGNRILARHRKAKVVYVTAEAFMNEMIQCLRTRRMDDFRAKYRQRATVLLVDDVQFLSGKDRTQEEFFHTFNALHSSGSQLVLSSDEPPEEIDKLEPRLRTRFQGGLLADMQAPDKETLLAILYQKSEAQGLPVPGPVADVIASSVAGNIRELEGVINKLSALHAFYAEPLTVPFVRKHLPAIFQPSHTLVSVAGIIEQVARFHSLRSSDILGNRRTRTLAIPRQIAMFLARKHTNLSFPELGREFDRDQSTIQYGAKKVEAEIGDNPDLAYKIRLIEQGLQGR